ncbi:hypothetical protein C8R46DRAFT_1265230 [Mycena filopes]|nr:hypothetical protein C8R46DRAFT_1265230 [Mycena filopes]
MADTTIVDAPGDELTSAGDVTPRAENEAPAAPDDLSLADLTTTHPPTDSAAGDDAESAPADTESNHEQQQEAAPEGKTAAAKAKVASTVKSAATKTNGAATGVKKILNSGTFGAGKSTSSKPTPASASASTTAKSATAGTAPPPKSAMASSTTKPAAPTSAAASARRASVVPSKTSAPPIKPSLSASSSSKPTTASSTTTARGSVVSPSGTAANGAKPSGGASAAARPRASVSEGVKRAPMTARQSLSATTKPPVSGAPKPSTSTARAPPTKAAAVGTKTRTGASITSIKEALEDLQAKLRETTESLESKTGTATELEAQVGELKASLAAALAEVETKGIFHGGIDGGQARLRLEHQEGSSALQSIQEDLEAAKTATTAQKDLIEGLQAQIHLESLQSSQSGDPEAAAAAAAEHETLLKTQADLSAIEAEFQAFKAEQAQTLEEAQVRLQAAEGKAAHAEVLEAQLVELRAEKEDAVAKLSEIEVEILELKESQETIEDERAKTAAKIASLEQELSQAAIDNALAKEAEYLSQADGVKVSHETELKAISEAHAQTTSQLEALNVEMEAAIATHQAATDEHTRRLGEAEEGYVKKQTELSDEIRRITEELEGQEAQYNAKVDAVKAEHDKLLQEAFERAKAEASDIHQQDLQALRSESGSTMDQVRAAHESALENLKADHASALESTVGGLEKQISKLNLELKATQEDLAKAKANVDIARSEVESLTAQHEEARAALSAIPQVSPQHVEEVSRLTNELGVAKDDLQAVTEMLTLTKASLQEMSNNHSTELEEAAKRRAEEVTKLRGAHDEEVNTLVTTKSELLTRLSDLEGELATLRATIDSGAAPKSNGAVAAPQSPGITKEELQRLHEAHNLKVGDLQAEHEKALKALADELEAAATKVDGLNAEVARKAMEIQYLESDQDEQTERITRLQEDLEALKLKAGTAE